MKFYMRNINNYLRKYLRGMHLIIYLRGIRLFNSKIILKSYFSLAETIRFPTWRSNIGLMFDFKLNFIYFILDYCLILDEFYFRFIF